MRSGLAAAVLTSTLAIVFAIAIGIAVHPQPAYSASFPNTQIVDSNGDQLVVCTQSIPVNISTATTTQIVALSGTTIVRVCGFQLTANGTTPTIQFEYGTGSNCGTGTTVLTGALAPTAGAPVNSGNSLGVLFAGTAGAALCIVSGGTTPSIQGVLSYAQF